MKLCMVVDAWGWCFDRTAEAMIRYHDTEHEWIKWNPHTDPEIPEADIYRVGGIPLYDWLGRHGYLEKRRFVPTVASFRDGEQVGYLFKPWEHLAIGLIINDKRQAQYTEDVEVPVTYSPDYADPEVFFPMPKYHPTDGPLRIGWAGSVSAWKNVKNVGELIVACSRTDGVEFVRQDRELDGQKSPDEMRVWLNSLDIYASANDIMTCTPVPTLEALACGVPVLTTMCGELWSAIARVDPRFIIASPTTYHVLEAIERVSTMDRDEIRKVGDTMLGALTNSVTWGNGEATSITRKLVEMKENA